MYKKTDKGPIQVDLFTSPTATMCSRAKKTYDNPNAWFNVFFKEITSKIDEDIFKPLYSAKKGRPSQSIRILAAMESLKEGLNCSDEQLFEMCDFNLLVRKALGLFSTDVAAPSLDTYYLFRRNIVEYEEKTGENLMRKAFIQVTKDQVKELKVNGKVIRMDSKLIGSNIAWYSRYQIVYTTFDKFLKEGGVSMLSPELSKRVLGFMNEEDAKETVYRSNSERIQNRLSEIGRLICEVLNHINAKEDLLLHRVFREQYIVNNGEVTPRDKKEISAKSVQNPNDPDADYRNKGDQTVKGNSVNVVETCDDANTVNLIVDVEVKGASAADNSYVQSGIEHAQEVTGDTVERIHTDGAYQSESNREYTDENKIDFVTTGVQGKETRYELNEEDGHLYVTDKKTGEVIDAHKCENGKYRVSSDGKSKYRYFTEENIRKSKFRQMLDAIPQGLKNIRNNVEATVFQYCFPTRNNKTRYRGLVKQQLYSYARCMWVNMRRICIYQMAIS